jgi:hypothetical protein
MKKLLLILMALFLWAVSSWAQNAIIGTGTSTTNGTTADPVERYYNYEHFQIVYLATELSTAGMPANATINALGFSISESAVSLSNYTIQMAHTTLGVPPVASGFIIVKPSFTYAPVVQTAGNFDMISFGTNFVWNGTDNIVIDICTGSNSYISPYGGLRYTTTTDYKTKYVRTDGSSNCATTVSSTTYSRPNIRFNYTSTVPNLAVAPTSLAFGYVLSGSYGYSQYILSGVNLTGFPGNIVVSPPAGFEISSVSASGPWTANPSSINVPYSSATLGNTTIYARFAPTGPPAAYSANITHVGGGASANEAVSGSSYLYSKYCTSTATNTADEDILNVTVGTLNNTSTCFTTGGPGSVLNLYSNYTTTIAAPDLQQGSTNNSFSVQVGTCGGNYSSAVKIFIDFDQNGDFAGSGEQVYVSAASVSGPHTESGLIAVPGGALLGNTMMRVVNVETSTPSGILACGTYSYGETEDYLVNIVPATSPTLVVVPTSINFGTVPSGSYGYNQYVLSGTNLTGYPGNIVVSPPAGFEISAISASGPWTANPSSINVPYTSATLGNTTIYARFAPTGSPASYNGNISNVGGGASANVAVTGSSWIITPTFSCQSIAASFPTTGIKIAVVMTTTNAYNFSSCSLDATCAGSGPSNDIDYTMFGTDGTTQLWYIDGATACSYDASTWGSTYDSWVPPANGTYYLQIDDYYNAAGSFTMGYIASVPTTTSTWTGLADTDWDNTGNWNPASIPTNTVKVIIPTGCPYYPHIDVPAECYKLTINSGGSLYMIDSFFDIFTEISCSGTLDIGGGITTVTGNLYLPATTGTLNMTNGILNVAGIFQNAAYTWSNGTFHLSGGTINMTGTAFFYGGTGSTMSGTAIFNVGGTLQLDNAMWTMTGGIINLLGTETAVNYFIPPTSTGTAIAYDLVVNAPGSNYTFSRDAAVNGDHIYNDFTVQAGTVSLQNLTGSPGTFTVDGDVTVKPAGAFDCNVSTAFNVGGSLVLEADASEYASWIDNAHVNLAKGLQEAQVAYDGMKWHMISAPIPDAVSGMFTGLYLQSHSETTNLWTDIVSTTDPLNVGQGYALYNTAAGTQKALFDGSFNTGAQSISLSRNNQGWNAVGNPYPSTIDWDASTGWTKTNVANATYVENGGNWASYIGGVGANGGIRYIAPGQGFFVECTNAGGGTLGMDKAVRTLTKVDFLKDSDPQLVRLLAEGNKKSDETVIRFNENANSTFDYNFDARKFFTYESDIPQLYSMDNGGMSINTLPATEMVAMGFKAGTNGIYTISTSETGEFSFIELEDMLTGTFTNLLEQSYTFEHNLLNKENRFIIHFKPLGVGNNFAENINIYSNNHVVYVSVPASLKGTIKVYNMMGQEAASSNITDVITRITLDKSAYYVVEVISEGSVVTEKVFVK